ncbi:hypothetical protein [Pseudohongiella spirulinae]|uniref:Uncharacterized protein n=1 Tax=Pseudohongiella spirulinae TaxID=1249552 RepID=A0A0S2KE62_9GAMM|nr:hypothetical protein [Pseudohongiella spirulinae]ALO46586.1 hypothetical protein PS2015_1942 [Pseudohongiella spirulinae]
MVSEQHADQVFNHAPPSKAEALLQKLNLRSPDYCSPMGGGTGRGLCPGEIAAALALGRPALPRASRFMSYELARKAMASMAMYVHTGDRQSFCHVYYFALNVIAGQMAAAATDMKSLAKEVAEHRGAMSACCVMAIDDVSCPRKYRATTDREFARIVGLPNHKLWSRNWKSRYQNIRSVIEELSDTAEQQIKNNV